MRGSCAGQSVLVLSPNWSCFQTVAPSQSARHDLNHCTDPQETRGTAPLWNPGSKDLLSVKEDEAGRLVGCRARFGRGFDAGREATSSPEVEDRADASGTKAEDKQKAEGAGLEDNDASLLVSSFGQESGARSHKKGGGKEKENEGFQFTPYAMFKEHMASERRVNPSGLVVVGSAQPNGPLPLPSWDPLAQLLH